ncbi:MAG: hypothetical protein MIO92_00805 [Methanosarcinaceae archaeon]|nr:hypothetical protein [Methanosarcinaceae archaeon]
MAQNPKITPAFKKKFLKLLSETGHVSNSCLALNVSRNEMYRHRRNSPKFEEKWKQALSDAVELLEDEAWRRAYEGIDRAVWYKGTVVGTEKLYSDTLLMHRLNAERPDKYHYRQQVDANVTADITVKVIKFSDGDNNPK